MGLEGNSIALLWHSVHCDLPLAPWVMKGLINESIRVSVCCSLCVSGMQSDPDVPSLRAHTGKGCHRWQAWWMGGTPGRDRDECDSPRLAKGRRRPATEGSSRDGDHLPLLVASTISGAERGGRWRLKGDEYHIIPSSGASGDLERMQERYSINALDKLTGSNEHGGNSLMDFLWAKLTW